MDQSPQHGLARIVVASDQFVVTVDSEKILDQIVGADASEIRHFQDRAGLQTGRGDFKHRAVLQVLYRQIADALQEDLFDGKELLAIDDHGVQSADRTVGRRPSECSRLRPEQLRPGQ